MGQESQSKQAIGLQSATSKMPWFHTVVTESGRKHVMFLGHKILSYPTSTVKKLKEQRKKLGLSQWGCATC